MNYKHIWMIEVSYNKKYWAVTSSNYFHTRKAAKQFIDEKGWGKSTNLGSFYRISKYMGPITSGCIKEI